MRPEGEILKDHLHIAFADGNFINRHAADEDGAGVGCFQSCDESERGGLAAAAFTDDDEKLAAVHVEARFIDGRNATELFRQAV